MVQTFQIVAVTLDGGGNMANTVINPLPPIDDICCIPTQYPINWPDGFSQHQWNIAILRQLADHEHRIEVLEHEQVE